MNPVFIKVDRYKKVHEVLERVRARLEDAKGVISRLNELREQEEKELHEWKAEISRIEGKIGFIEESFTDYKER